MSLYLKLFGGLSLVATDTGAVRVTRRHRLATLAILANSDRPVPRERILALLWPDSSDEGGRHSLGQVLYGLRQDLGTADAVVGAADLTLQRSVIGCDLWTFRSALAGGDHRAALEVYTGPFLDGIHLPGADPFDRWCEEERTALTRQARDAMQSLATAADAANESTDAIRWWRQLAASDPLSSRVALSLMRTLVASGDRAAAVQHARVHAALVKAELDADADPAVLAFAEELKRSPKPTPSGRATEVAVQALDAVTDEVAPRAVDQPLAPFPQAPRRSRRSWAVGAVAIVVASLVVASRFLPSRVPPRQESTGVPVVGVLPFDVRGDTARAFLGEALSALLSTRLDAPGVLRTLESNAVLNAVGKTSDNRGDDADSRVAALGADILVHGTVVVLGDRLEIVAELRSRDSADARVFRANATGSVDSLFVLADRLGTALLVAREGRVLGNAVLGGTVSVPALKAFLSGERALRAWRLDEALLSYREAVRIDSSYAMAWYRQSFVQGWSKEGDGGARARTMTLRLASQLPPRHALLLAALVARARGDYGAAERGLLTLVQRYEDDADPWAELGEFRMHVGPLLGRPTANAEAPLARALVLDSAGHPEVRYHLTQLAMERGDTARARALVAPLLPISARSDRTVRFLQMMLAMGGGTADTGTLVRTLRELSANDVASMLRLSMFSVGVTPLGRALVDSLIATTDSRDHRRAGLALMQEMAIAQRRWSAAITTGAALAAMDSVAAADEWSILATAMDAEIPTTEWRRAGDVLERAASGDTSALGWKRRLAAGTLAVRAGDAGAYARRLSLLTRRARPPAWFTTELHVLRAFHADAVRDSLESARELDAIGPAMESPTGRWLRARSLERSGQLETASAWYLSSPWGPDGLVLTRAALEHASAIAAKRGNMADADTFARRAVRFGGGGE